MGHTKEPLKGEQLDAALNALLPGDELWIEAGIFVRRNKDSSLSYFVRLYYKRKKYEFWQGIKDLLTAKARYVNSQVEIAQCKKRNERWEPPSDTIGETSTIQAHGLTLRQWAEVWYREIVCVANPQSTQRKYREYLKNHVYPALGHMPMASITEVHLEELGRAIRAKPAPRKSSKLSWGTAHVVLRMLAGCFHHARKRGVIQTVPFPRRLSTLIGRKEKTHVRQTWTREQVEQFLNGALRYDPEWHPIFMTFFRTGCRLGEVLALKPDHLNFTKRRIRIEQAYSEGVIGKPKNKCATEIHMSQDLEKVLKEHCKRRLREEEIRGFTFTYLFGWHRNQTMAPTTLRDRFKKLASFLKLPRIRVHDTRHTAAELLLEGGAPTIYVRDQLRHSSESTTTDIYGATINHRIQHVDMLDQDGKTTHADQITSSDQSAEVDMAPPPVTWPVSALLPSRDGIDFRQAVHHFEQQLIHTALKSAKGSRSTAAALLRLPRGTFLNKLNHLGRSTRAQSQKPMEKDTQPLFNPLDSSDETAA